MRALVLGCLPLKFLINPDFCTFPTSTVLFSLPDSPHVYALIGGGEWGPRVAAQALLEAVYVKAWNHVTVVDLAAAAQVRETQGLEAVR